MKDVITFSFPFGKQNNILSSLASVAGYSFACGVYSGPASFSADRFNLRRLSIEASTGPFSYLMRLRYPYNWIEFAYFRFVKSFRESVSDFSISTKNRIKRDEHLIHSQQGTEST